MKRRQALVERALTLDVAWSGDRPKQLSCSEDKISSSWIGARRAGRTSNTSRWRFTLDGLECDAKVADGVVPEVRILLAGIDLARNLARIGEYAWGEDSCDPRRGFALPVRLE